MLCFEGSGKYWVAYTADRGIKLVQSFHRIMFQYAWGFKGFIPFDVIIPLLETYCSKISKDLCIQMTIAVIGIMANIKK